MKRFQRACAVAVFLLSSSVAALAQTSSPDPTDTQQWNELQIAVPVTKTIDFNLLFTLRFGRDVSHPVDERVGAGFNLKFGKYFSVSPNYLQVATQPFKGRSVSEDRLSLPFSLRFAVGKFRLSDRNLFERRFRHPGGDSTRYRNKFQVDHPVGPTSWKLSAFVADEVFYDWSLNSWARNRVQVGVSKVFDKHFTGDLYYLRQNDSHSVPGDLHVLGTVLRIRL